MRLLLAEDEPDLNRIITKKLISAGYSVDSCHDGEEAFLYLSSAEYDGAILDVMMPKLDGFAVLRRMRAEGILTPVLFLTARDAVEDRVAGLDLGASDYLVKPFAFAELMARIRVMTRVVGKQAANILSVADLEMDCASHKVTRAGREISLSAKEYAMLEYLMRNENVVLSREKIENNIWNFDYEGGTNIIDVYISYLRRKIDDGQAVKLIHTVRGKGYVLRAGEEKNR